MARKFKPCGTEAAYRRHLRNKEKPCEACREAMRLARSKQRNQSNISTISTAGMITDSEEDILREVLCQLRGRMVDAPPQAVASIAKGIRDTLEALNNIGNVQSETGKAGIIDEIAKRRQARQDRLAEAARGKSPRL